MFKVICDNKNIILKEIKYFDLLSTLDCGQAFRWNVCDDGSYFGIVEDRPLRIFKKGNDVVLNNCTMYDYNSYWKNYFDMDCDYDEIIAYYKDDEFITKGVEGIYGTRLLNQPEFETIISFIISANNNVKRIKGIIERICQGFGTKIGDDIYAFPTIEQLSKGSIDDFKKIGAGYRAPYIYNTTRLLCDGYDFKSIRNMEYIEAKKEIQSLKGVGPKVADCILLYAYGFRNAFPIDVWMRRIIEQLYLKKENATLSEIDEFVCDYFKNNAGIAQLFLFNYARKSIFNLTK